MTLIQTFHGNATNGTELTAVYAEQPAANVAFALVFPGNDLPRLVHWGRPLAAPATAIDMFDAQMPQRVSGALDYTSWPSVLPTQSESWIGATRFDVRRDGVELFCKFAVSNITAETVAAGKTYVMGEKDGYPSWSVADEPKQTPTATVT
ncbi:alpha-galactosidase, partial [Enterococcus durans]|nr:alpha-galactosidase [Enterococcus durans]